MSFRGSRRPVSGPELTPMIDVVFLLVVFFMLSTTFVRRDGDLEVRLPAAEAPPAALALEDVVLAVGTGGRLELDGSPVTLADLPERLRGAGLAAPSRGASSGGGRVVLRADLAVPHGEVVGVLDACREAGVDRVAIATTPSGATASGAR